MEVFEYQDHRTYLKTWLENQPKAGRGVLRAWSLKFSVHPSLLSQILSGKRALTLELADLIADEIALTEAESNYFQLLVLYENAGTHSLKKKILKRMEEARTKARTLAERVRPDIELSEEVKSTFYSNWIYSGIRNLTAIAEYQEIDAIARRLNIPRETISSVLEFLIESGLVRRENGKLELSAQKTVLPATSPLVQNHHRNWRLHGFSKMPMKRSDDLFLTVPMSLSKEDAKKIRELLPAWISEIQRILSSTESETVRCLNADFFEY